MEFLLEIGVEDLPADIIAGLPEQLSVRFKTRLDSHRIAFSALETYATIRRMVIRASGLPEKQPDLEKEVAGPPAAVAFLPEGGLSPAGAGYCRAQGITADRLLVREAGKKRTTYYIKQTEGRPVREVLSEFLPEFLAALSFPLTMRWGTGEAPAFIRPVTSLLCLLNDQPIPIAFAGIKSAPFTTGHPILKPTRRRIATPAEYFEGLEETGITLDLEERCRVLADRVKKILPDDAVYQPDQLRQLAATVEYPEAGLGGTKIAGIPYPLEIVSQVIQNLKCLPLYNGRGELRPEFVIVVDGRITREIRDGFHWVLESRMEDAGFFWKEDTLLPVEARLKTLEKVVFQESVGTMSDYGRALAELTGKLAGRLGFDPAAAETLAEAGRLAKLDLTTSSVREFPAVAGIMAGRLLELESVPAEVCGLVREHLYPKFPGDRLPKDRPACLLACADKTLHLCGLFLAGIEASGSADPYGLRRLAQGILELAWQSDFRLEWPELLAAAVRAWGRPEGEAARIHAFFEGRLANGLENQGFRPDVAAAALGGEGRSVTSAPKRAAALTALLAETAGTARLTTFSRITNIIGQAREKELEAGQVREADFTEAAERSLFEAWRKVRPEVEARLDSEDYPAALAQLARLDAEINLFFDQVLVMCPDPEVRRNRLGLLAELDATLRRLGNLRRLQF
ncbi:MAG TPA: glycine--tRNA ligase subunit beta [bacterium]|nr:glycine--tRNA ligase subunit beta [bacterium]HNS49352.1 glycine--tRNA ligase subunit beta [bacterium]